MKRHILLIAFLASLGGYAQQLHNANWYFGNNAGYSFLADPDPTYPTSISTSLQSSEICGSYSNGAGQFMFYTNGRDVYNGNNTPMTNGSGLIAHDSDSQLVLIKKPNTTDPGRLAPETIYLISNDGTQESRKGLRYSEVNVSDGISGEVVLATKNTVLRDHNNVPIDENYGSRSEKVTSALHCNGTDYWLVTQIGGFIYSYHVTQAGIPSTPTTVSTAPYNIATGESSSGAGLMKISPNNDRIAIAYFINTSNFTGAVAMGDFDSSTGAVTFDPALITVPTTGLQNAVAYGVEFSPDSQRILFSVGKKLYTGNAYTASSANVTLVPMTGTGGELVNEIWGMQLGMNGKIYVAVITTSLTAWMAVIDDPNSPTNPNFSFNNSPGVTLGTLRGGLPQWVKSQMAGCDTSFTLFNPDLNIIPHIYRVGHHIDAVQNYKVSAGRNITMRAGKYINLLPNTTIESGSIFLAEILACPDCGTSSVTSSEGEVQGMRMPIVPQGLQLYPNPASDRTNLSVADDIITFVTVTSLDGSVIFKGSNDKEKYVINTSAYKKGIYIINVQTKNGKNYIEKLIVE